MNANLSATNPSTTGSRSRRSLRRWKAGNQRLLNVPLDRTYHVPVLNCRPCAMSICWPAAGAATPQTFSQVRLFSENGVRNCAQSDRLLAPEQVWAAASLTADAKNSALRTAATRLNIVGGEVKRRRTSLAYLASTDPVIWWVTRFEKCAGSCSSLDRRVSGG